MSVDEQAVTTYRTVVSTNVTPPLIGSMRIEVEGPSAVPPLSEDDCKRALAIYDVLWAEMRRRIANDLGFGSDLPAGVFIETNIET